MSHSRKSVFVSAPARSIRMAASIVCFAAVLTCSGFSQKLSNAQPTDELPAGPMAAKATTACTECHEARIILQQRLSKAGWTKEVDKMSKWGAVVDASDRDAFIDYLSTNFSPDKPQYGPPRTLPEKTSEKKTTHDSHASAKTP
jgi:hypothetical protein